MNYSIPLLFKEASRSALGYYSSFSSLAKRIKAIHIVLAVFIFLILGSLTVQLILGKVIGSNSSVASHWNKLNIWDILAGNNDSFIKEESVDQSILFKFALYFFFLRTWVVSLGFVFFIYLIKASFAWTAKSYNFESSVCIDLLLNPCPVYSYKAFKTSEKKVHTRTISFVDLMNKFLDKQSFPEISSEEEPLLKVSSLSFMYHGDNSWDKWIHSFLKKYLPAFYYRHLLNTNTVSREEEVEKKHLHALNNINLNLKSSKFTTILGCNGSSKTTFLKAIINLFEKYSGNIVWITKDLKSISHKSFYKNIAYVSQDNVIQNKISVYDYVACGLFPSFSFFKFSYPTDHPLIINNLKKMGILQHKDKDMNSLSGGEKQKAIIARVLTQETKVIILDEPTTYLDISNQYLILNLLKKLQVEENKTIITILHDIKQAEQFSDEVVLLDNGEVYAYGKTKDVINSNNIKQVFDVNWY